MNIKKHSGKIASVIVTSVVIMLVFFAGPAKAFVLSLDDFSDSSPVQGAIISTTFLIEINSNERMSLENPVSLYIDDSEYCSFDIDGTSSDCSSHGITISQISSTTDYGYGYGYGYGYDYGYGYNQGYSNGIIEYEIEIDTSYFSTATHTMQLFLDAGESHIYESEEKEFTISTSSTSGGSEDDGDSKSDSNENIPSTSLVDKEDKKSDEVVPDLESEETEQEETSQGGFLGITGSAIKDFVNSGKAIPTMVCAMIITFGAAISIISFKRKRLKFKR